MWPRVAAVDLSAGMLARVMAPGAVLAWPDALGDGAPFFVPVEVLAAVMAAAGRAWDVVHSQAHWGSWAVLRPAGLPHDPPQAHP